MKLVSHSYVEGVFGILIGINSIALMLGDPALKDDYGVQTVEYINRFCTAVFIIEVVIKVISMGFYKGKHSYLKSDGFNVFDFILVVAIIASLIVEGIYHKDEETMQKYNGIITAIKALKSIRPLRLARSSALRNTVHSVMAAIPMLGHAASINFLFIYIFSILAV
jgi:voltage-dependent calcium channel T type alpha-1H